MKSKVTSKCECYIDDLGDLEICDNCAELKKKWYNKLVKDLQDSTNVLKLKDVLSDDLDDEFDIAIVLGDFNDSAIYYIFNETERSIYIKEFDKNENPQFEDRYDGKVCERETISYEEIFSRMMNRIKEEF